MTNKDFKEGNGLGTNFEYHNGGTINYPKHRTIDDLECGDYVVGKYGKKLCLAICGKLYGMSYNNDFETLEGWFTLKNLMEMEYTLYQPTEEKETLEKELFDMVYGWGQNRVVTDEKCNAFKDLIAKLKKETDIDRCIKVVDGYIGDTTSLLNPQQTKNNIVQALKNLKK